VTEPYQNNPFNDLFDIPPPETGRKRNAEEVLASVVQRINRRQGDYGDRETTRRRIVFDDDDDEVDIEDVDMEDNDLYN
jgi:hypothetical protein